MNKITKIGFIDLIVKSGELIKAEAEKSLNIITENIQKILKNGDKLSLIGFGSFYIIKNKAREGRNPKTGEVIKIKESNQLKFKTGSKLKEACRELIG